MMKKEVFIFRDMPLHIGKSENIIMFILSFISGICSIVQVYALSGFIDIALQSVHNNLFDRKFFGMFFLLFGTVAVDWLIPRVNGILRQRAELKLLREYRPRMLEKCASLKYVHVEQAESHDLIARVLKEPEKQWQGIPSIRNLSWLR
jgi:ABC-type multidrug transport system fused ATPase/permease subunit